MTDNTPNYKRPVLISVDALSTARHVQVAIAKLPPEEMDLLAQELTVLIVGATRATTKDALLAIAKMPLLPLLTGTDDG